MSDSPEDRSYRGRRGSLLDHVRDTQSAAPESARPDPEADARRAKSSGAAASSLLTTPNRSARVSTSRYADRRPEPPAQPARSLLSAVPAGKPVAPEPDITAQSGENAHTTAQRKSAPGRERFGDRIARLIGTIAPDAGTSTGEPEPVAQRDHDQSQPGAGRYARPRTGPEAWPEHDLESSQQPVRAPRQGHSGGDDHYHWHAAGGPFEDGNRPLLDASILISAVWRFRRLIAAATVAGAVVGVLMALSTPHKYYAESRLFVDPREIRLTEDDIRNQQLSTEAMLAITDSQLQILSSTSVLEKVVEDLGLDRDPEFNGSMAPGGIGAGIALISELFTGSDSATEGEQKALNNLREALSVGRDARTFVIIVGVETRDPEKSALIANQIVETYLDSEGQAQSSLLERTSESIDTRINSLRADLDAAEREVERYKADNGLVGVGGQLIDDKEILALSDQLANARAMKVGIRVKAENLAGVKIDDVLSGAFPEELLSSNLSELRKQYAQTKSNADSLATRLGPRHPQYIAAMQSLETITSEISAELRRIVASSQTELQRAVETEQELASQMAVAKSRAVDQSVELVTLRELERKAAATRGIYEAFLIRSRETSERSNLSTRNVRVISPAEAPLQPMGPSRKFIAIGGMIAGFLAGFGLALLAGAVESIRAYNGAQYPARYPSSPAGGYPQPPAPGPRTPPSGPGQRFWPRGGGGATGRDAAAAPTPEPSAYGARAHHDADAPGGRQASTSAQKPAFRDVFRIGLLRPKPVHGKTSVFAKSGAPGVSAEAPAPHPENGRNAQAIFATHGQPQDLAGPEAFRGQAAYQSHHAAQPGWASQPEPVRSQPQDHLQPQPHLQAQMSPPYPQPQHVQPQPQYPGLQPQPYQPPLSPQHFPSAHQVPFQPGGHPAGPVPQPYQGQPPQAYQPLNQPYLGHPMNQPSFGFPVQPQPIYPQPPQQAYPHPAAPAWPAPNVQPHQQQYAPAPGPMPASTWPQADAPAASAPPSPPQPVESAPQARDTQSVDRIRREMGELRARIDGYGSQRRRA